MNSGEAIHLLQDRVSKDGGVVELTGELLPELSPLLTALRLPALTLTHVRTPPPEEAHPEAPAGSRLIFAGQTSFLEVQRMPIWLYIGESAPLRLCLIADLPRGWRITDSLPELPPSLRPLSPGHGLLTYQPSLLRDVVFQDAHWLVTNYADSPAFLAKGLNLSASVDARVLLGDVFPLVSSEPIRKVRGPIRLPPSRAHPPSLSLQLLGAGRPLEAGPVRLPTLRCRIRTADDSESSQMETRVEVGGTLSLGAPEPVTLEVWAPLLPTGRTWHLVGEAGDDRLSLGNGIEAIVQLAGGDASDFELPDTLQDLGRLHVRRFFAALVPTTGELERVSLTVGSDATWSLADDLVSIGGLSIMWFILFPLRREARYNSVHLSGVLGFGRGEQRILFDVSTHSTVGFQLSGSLREGQRLRVSELVASALGVDAGLPELDVSQLYFSATSQGDFTLSGGSPSTWSIPLGVTTLEAGHLGVTITHQRATPSSASTTAVHLTGFAGLAGVRLRFSARRTPGQGWELTAEAPGEELSLQSLVSTVCGAIGFDFSSLPSLFDTLVLRDPRLTLDLGTGAVAVNGSAPGFQRVELLARKVEGTWGFALGLVPSPGWSLAELLPIPELRELRFDLPALVLASAQFTDVSFTTRGLPSGRITRGLQFGATVELAQLQLLQLVGLSSGSARVSATLGRTAADLRLRMELSPDLRIDLAEGIVLHSPAVELSPQPFEFGLSCKLDVRLDESPLTFVGAFAIKDGRATMSGTLAGLWHNPCGARGVAVGPLALELSLPGLPSLAGTVYFGSFSAAVAIKADPAAPVLSARFQSIDFGDLLAALCEPAVQRALPPRLTRTLFDISLDDVGLTIVGRDTTIGTLRFEQGLTLRARMSFFGLHAGVVVRSSVRGGLEIRGDVEAPDLGDLLTLRDTQVLLELPAPSSPYRFDLQAHVGLLGLSTAGAVEIHLSDDGFTFEVGGSLLGTVEADLTVRGRRLALDGGLTVQARLRTEWLNANLTRGVLPLIREYGERARQALAEAHALVEARNTVGVLAGELEQTRAKVRQEREDAARALRDAQSGAARWRAEVDSLDGAITSVRRTIEEERRSGEERLRSAQSAVSAAQREVDRLDREIDETNRWFYSLPRVSWPWKRSQVREGAYYGLKIGGLYAVRYTAWGVLEGVRQSLRGVEEGVARFPIEADPRMFPLLGAREAAHQSLVGTEKLLEGLEKGVNLMPIDADPRIQVLLRAQDTASLGLMAAQEALAQLEKGVGEIPWLAEQLVESLQLEAAGFEGSLNVVKEGRVKLFVTLSGGRTYALDFELTRPLECLPRLANLLLGLDAPAALSSAKLQHQVALEAPRRAEELVLPEGAIVAIKCLHNGKYLQVVGSLEARRDREEKLRRLRERALELEHQITSELELQERVRREAEASGMIFFSMKRFFLDRAHSEHAAVTREIAELEEIATLGASLSASATSPTVPEAQFRVLRAWDEERGWIGFQSLTDGWNVQVLPGNMSTPGVVRTKGLNFRDPGHTWERFRIEGDYLWCQGAGQHLHHRPDLGEQEVRGSGEGLVGEERLRSARFQIDTLCRPARTEEELPTDKPVAILCLANGKYLRVDFGADGRPGGLSATADDPRRPETRFSIVRSQGQAGFHLCVADFSCVGVLAPPEPTSPSVVQVSQAWERLRWEGEHLVFAESGRYLALKEASGSELRAYDKDRLPADRPDAARFRIDVLPAKPAIAMPMVLSMRLTEDSPGAQDSLGPVLAPPLVEFDMPPPSAPPSAVQVDAQERLKAAVTSSATVEGQSTAMPEARLKAGELMAEAQQAIDAATAAQLQAEAGTWHRALLVKARGSRHLTSSGWVEAREASLHLEKGYVEVPTTRTLLRTRQVDGREKAEAVEVPTLELGAEFTLEAWIRVESIAEDWASLLNKWSEDGEGEFLFGLMRDGRLGLRWRSAGHGEAFSEARVPPGRWTHVAVVRGGDTLTFYLDGLPSGSIQGLEPVPLRAGALPLRIGAQARGGTSRDFHGHIDEVRLWSVARAPGELRGNRYRHLLGSEPGLIGYWPLDEGDGSLTVDRTPGRNHGTVTGAARWAAEGAPTLPPSFGGSIHLNGGYVEPEDGAALTAGIAFSFEAWIRVESIAEDWASLLNKWSEDGEGEFLFGLMRDGRLGLRWRSAGHGEAFSEARVPPGRWTHVAVVRGGDTLTFYLDGLPSGSTQGLEPVPLRAGVLPLRIGAQARGGVERSFIGQLREVRMWSVALSPEEVRECAASTVAGTDIGLLGCWRFDEGEGQLTFDQTSRGRHGQRVGRTQWRFAEAPTA